MINNKTFSIAKGNENYPHPLYQRLGEKAPGYLHCLGNSSLLQNKVMGFACSQYCPPSLILKIGDIFKVIRNCDYSIASGFHSPVEQEALQIIIRGTSPVIIMLARSLQGMRLKPEYRTLLDQDRLLLLSPFETDIKRISTASSLKRNSILAALSHTLFIPYAHPCGNLEQLCLELSQRHQIFYTLDSEYNRQLLAQGAKIFKIE